VIKATRFMGLDCVELANDTVQLLVTRSVGPRVISLRFQGGDNLLAELPDFTVERPDGRLFFFLGGHRLWHAPEMMPRTYVPDDQLVEIVPAGHGLRVTRPVEPETGIEKAIRISLARDGARVTLAHKLTNHGLWPIECAPWAITQFKTGGVAILPQSGEGTGLVPNRSLAIWPYTDVTSPHLSWGNRYLLVRAEMESGAFKIGFPNPRGWLAYWFAGTLFVKRAPFHAGASYCDLGSSSECYCNDRFIELETLAPVGQLAPRASVTHTETWELYAGVNRPSDEAAATAIAEELGLE
jgi:hypothetical protein